MRISGTTDLGTTDLGTTDLADIGTTDEGNASSSGEVHGGRSLPGVVGDAYIGER